MPFWRKSPEVGCPPPHLDEPEGRYAVGFVDVMTPGNFSGGCQDEMKNGVFFRLYYPMNVVDQESEAFRKEWPEWIDQEEYLKGTVSFLQAVAARWPSWASTDDYKYFGMTQRLAPCIHLGLKHTWNIIGEKVHCPMVHEGFISKDKVWPLVLFSHGLGCCKFSYTLLCSNLASHGFVVAAVEHRDGSACYSYARDTCGALKHVPHTHLGQHDDEYKIRDISITGVDNLC